MDETVLIEQVLRGDREAYAGLVRDNQGKIYRLCASLLGNDADAEDAAQEVFVKAYQSLASFRKQSAFSTWLYRIASNHCRDLLRKRSRLRTDSLESLIEASGDAAEKLAVSADPRAGLEAADLLRALFSRLSAEERLILSLREGEQLSYQEIGGVLGCSLDAVKARLRRAREAIEEKMRHFSGAGASKG